MRVLVLTPTFLPVVGGAEMVLLEVYRRVARRHEVLLLTPHLSERLLREHGSADYDGLVTFDVERFHDRVSFMRFRGHRWSGGLLPPFSLSAAAAIRTAARRFRPDVLNVHYVMPMGLAAVMAERSFGVPVVVTVNGRDIPGPRVPPLWRWWQRAVLRSVTDVTYVSGYCRQALYGRGGRGQVVYNGVEIPPPCGDGAAIRRQLGVAEDEPLIFSLQRLAAEKRTDVLIRAQRRCLDRLGRGTLIVGGQGPEETRLRALAAAIGTEQHVKFVGYIPRASLGGYFTACDAFAFHSTFETFGIVIAQAMSYGRPVLTVQNSCLPEIVGDAGLLVPTGDEQAMGEAMAALITDGDLRRRLGERGRRKAEGVFNWDRIAERYEAILVRAARSAPA